MEVVKDLNELLPKVNELANKLILECKKQGIIIRVTETYRSQERQNELYEKGRTTAGKVVTWTKKSKHTTRRAFDIVPVVNGKATYSHLKLFDQIGEIGKKLGLTWGGSWKTQDLPHFQYDAKIEEVTIVGEKTATEHWAEKYYTYLINNGLDIKEKRFDDKTSRGEIFKIIAIMKGFKE
ncbi:MAG TPA: hypothetical protein DCP90_03950 [Clostridiales bacterium]|nr:MAG: hypothetical protein A2Y22_07180 [Clostridiales bacterium GWD2_32_59]HAN09748.1 hypothetical protein [Clostridiales bacterium]